MKFDATVNRYLVESETLLPNRQYKLGKLYVQVRPNGDKFYYKNAECTINHRLDGPAIEYKGGSEEWWVNDKRHRLDGPAVTYMNQPNATKYWFVDGKKHRVDGPAIEYHNGTKEWYVNDKQHRLDGPAVIFANGMAEWYINDIRLTPKEVEEQKKKIAVKQDIQSHKNNRIDPRMLEDYL